MFIAATSVMCPDCEVYYDHHFLPAHDFLVCPSCDRVALQTLSIPQEETMAQSRNAAVPTMIYNNGRVSLGFDTNSGEPNTTEALLVYTDEGWVPVLSLTYSDRQVVRYLVSSDRHFPWPEVLAECMV